MLLDVKGVCTAYEEVQVLWGVDLQIEGVGEITALIGSNGAGKSSFLKTLVGVLQPMHGEIFFGQIPLEPLSYDQRVKLGISYVPEGRRLFYGLTVEENLVVGGYVLRDKVLLRKRLDRVYGYFPILKERRSQLAGTLSGGEQQMCAIGRGLMAQPKLLMLDELSLGLAPVIVEQLTRIIKEISKEDVGILLVEQDVHTALEIAQKGYVLETGRVVLSGKAEELLSNPHIQKAYLGM